MLKKARIDAEIEVQAYREAKQAKFDDFRKKVLFSFLHKYCE
jgi:hypothetical protein